MNCRQCLNLRKPNEICWECSEKQPVNTPRSVKLSDRQLLELTGHELSQYSHYLFAAGDTVIECVEGTVWVSSSKLTKNIIAILKEKGRTLSRDALEAAILYIYTNHSALINWNCDPISTMYKFLGRFRAAKILMMSNYMRALLEQATLPGRQGEFLNYVKESNQLSVMVGAVEVVFSPKFSVIDSNNYASLYNNLINVAGQVNWCEFDARCAEKCF
ncbi:hypothetical protein BNJ_00300 [Kaumoebavirus]|uniref:hypothetical protein n=1 Tax=Kaumoebavirus TaxID=1859492 RepID=UPI0009C2A3B1|nr:hypothetical protein BNJ_00300 [Kaumoebavirus]ARA72122.1 hypothetical protein BNJ_00300 [Kaumoebavirus]